MAFFPSIKLTLLPRDSINGLVWIFMKPLVMLSSPLQFELFSILLYSMVGLFASWMSLMLSYMVHFMRMFFMQQPLGFIDHNHPNFVCKLCKAIYGLKHALRAWYNELKVFFLLPFGFVLSTNDTSLFIYHKDTITLYFLVYVNYLIVTGNHTDFSARFLRALPHRFFLKDLGDLHYFLGIKVLPTLTSLLLTQHKYIWDLLAKTNMACAKECVMPMSSTSILQLNDGSPSTNAITFL